jgi:hypothetical protein
LLCEFVAASLAFGFCGHGVLVLGIVLSKVLVLICCLEGGIGAEMDR